MSPIRMYRFFLSWCRNHCAAIHTNR